MTNDQIDAAIVAQADGHKPKDERWTVLTIYAFPNERMAASRGFDSGRFVAEIVGESTVKGEQRRVRRASFATVAKALKWGAFNEKSTLFGELRRKAIDWMEAYSRSIAGGLVGVSHGGSAVDDAAPEILTEPPPCKLFASRQPWNGEGGFYGALLWLYEPVAKGDVNEAVPLFVADWAASPETVEKFGGGFYSAGEPISAANVFDVIDHEEEIGRPPWAETFCRAMLHFDREGFHARVR